TPHPAARLATFVRIAAAWTVRNIRDVLLYAAIAFVVAYVINVGLMMFYYDGYRKTVGGPATGEGNVGEGMLFWGIITSVLFALVAYARAVGRDRFWADLRGFPRAITATLQRDG